MVHKRGPGKRGKRRATAALRDQVRGENSHVASSQYANKKDNQTQREKPTSFLDLPAELRNEIYDLALIVDEPLWVGYSGNRFYADPRHKHGKLSAYEAHMSLRTLSLTNRRIKKEAYTFFYANNDFKFMYLDSYREDVYYLRACAKYLHRIGSEGRPSIRFLSLEGHPWDQDLYQNHYYAKAIASLFRLLDQCVNLTVLQIHHPLALAPAKIKNSKRAPLRAGVQSLVDHFNKFSNSPTSWEISLMENTAPWSE